MAKKLLLLKIKRDPQRMYYVKNGAVWSVPRKRPGVKKGQKRVENKFGTSADLDYSKNIYFVDKAGDLCVAPRAKRGGKKKAKSKK
jgi:hypothetical protein